MANLQNLRVPTREEAQEMQRKSVEARNKKKLIREEVAKEIWAILDEDPSKLHEIARGFVSRAAENSSDAMAMADIMDGKQKESVAVENEHIIIRRHRNDD